MSGYEAGDSMVLPSQMEELSELADGLTPLQGLQTRVMAHPTSEVINLYSKCPAGHYRSDLCTSNLLTVNSQLSDVKYSISGFQN